MAPLVQSDKYVAMNKTDTTTNGFYAIMFISEAYTLKNNITIDGQIISAGELLVKAQYIFSMQENIRFYWKKQPLKHTIIFTTSKIIHQCLNVSGITDV